MKLQKGDIIFFKDFIDGFSYVPLYKEFEIQKVFSDGSFYINFQGCAIWVGDYELDIVEKVKGDK